MHGGIERAGALRGRWVRRCGVTIAGVAVAAVLVSCASGAASTRSVATAKATPSATSTAPEATASPTKTAAPTANPEAAALVEAYKSLPINEFNALPREQRLKVVWDTYNTMGRDGDLGDYMKTILPGGTKAMYDYNPTQTLASTADNGQLIIDQYLFASQAAAAQKKDITSFGDGPLDFNHAQQLLSGVTYEVGAKDKSPDYRIAVETMKENVNAANLTGSESFLALDTSVLKKGVDADGQPIEYKNVLLNPGTGRTHKIQFNFTTFRGADGQEHSLWLEVSDTYATSL